MNMQSQLLIATGIVLIVLGLVFSSTKGLFRLPGDIVFTRGNFTFYFPVATGILLSIILTLIFKLFKK